MIFNMEEIVKVIQDVGLYACIIVVFLWIGFKYIPKYLDLKLKKMQDHDDMMDLLKATIDNNSKVIDNNTEVIKLNSATIKNYTDNSHKLEDKIDGLTEIVHETNKNVEILRERR